MEKIKIKAFRVMQPFRSYICINNRTLQQSNLSYTWDIIYPMKEERIWM